MLRLFLVCVTKLIKEKTNFGLSGEKTVRYLLGILFVIFFVGFAACTFLLGGPPSQVFQLSDILLGGALLCAALSLVSLGILALGFGANGRKISLWRVPLLCLIFLLASLGISFLLFTSKPLGNTVEHLALDAKLRVCTWAMVGFGVFMLGGLAVSLITAKSHNAKLV